jgi:hypothetical protein
MSGHLDLNGLSFCYLPGQTRHNLTLPKNIEGMINKIRGSIIDKLQKPIPAFDNERLLARFL